MLRKILEIEIIMFLEKFGTLSIRSIEFDLLEMRRILWECEVCMKGETASLWGGVHKKNYLS
jgi:hypothetical protein